MNTNPLMQSATTTQATPATQANNPTSPLFKPIPGDTRLTTFPINRPGLWAWYEDALNCVWTPNEVPVGRDAFDYKTKLCNKQKCFVNHVLAFFAASDGIININLASRFKQDVRMLEAGYFYDFQITMENIHAQMYGILINDIIPSEAERIQLQNAVTTMPIITKITKWITACIDSNASFAERLLRMACVEGILFTGCFCAIYWLQGQGLMPGLAQSNELIARDEALHTMFAMYLYSMLEPEHKIIEKKIVGIFTEAVDLGKEFFAEALPEGMAEMNSELMANYIENQADNLLTLINVKEIYHSKHNFHFMEKLNLANRSNFFERRVSEYSKPTEVSAIAYEISNDF